MPLHNRINKEVLKQRLEEENFRRKTISFYRYVRIVNPEEFRNQLYKNWKKQICFGRIYVASEGINAQMSIPEHNYTSFLEELNSYPELKKIPIKEAIEDDGKSFYKLIIKVKPKIVADGLNDENFDFTNVGKHLSAKEFNEAMEKPETIVVDMRNHYESEIGHFENAICPDADTFREELPMVKEILEDKKEQKILLYCTGGIRCEKASAYLKHHGFEDVNQLHGGIIDYARQVEKQGLESKFIGKNFVFDDRLGERIGSEIISECHQCGKACDSHTNCAYDDCHLLFIQCEACAEKYKACCSDICHEMVQLPREEQLRLKGQIEIPGKGKHAFKKLK